MHSVGMKVNGNGVGTKVTINGSPEWGVGTIVKLAKFDVNNAYHYKVKIPCKPGGKILWCADVDIERA
jgi:hypothetical protein